MSRLLPVIPDDLKDPKLPKEVFSHSQYGLYKKCGYAYEYRYIKKIDTAPAVRMFLGSTVHTGAEEAHQHMINTSSIPGVEAMKAVVSDTFEKRKGEVENWEDQTQGSVKDTALKLYTKYHTENLPQLRPIAAEEGFAQRVGTVPMLGYIDLVEQVTGFGKPDPSDPLVIVDLKTGSAKWSADKVRKDTQLTLYTLVKKAAAGRIDNLVPLKAGPVLHRLDTVRTAGDKAVFVEDLEETVDLIKKGVFPKAPIDSWACSEEWCGYWLMCRGRKR